jgi:hypothetical protein
MCVCNVPEGNLKTVAIESGEFVRLDFDNAGEKEIQYKRGIW